MDPSEESLCLWSFYSLFDEEVKNEIKENRESVELLFVVITHHSSEKYMRF